MIIDEPCNRYKLFEKAGKFRTCNLQTNQSLLEKLTNEIESSKNTRRQQKKTAKNNTKKRKYAK